MRQRSRSQLSRRKRKRRKLRMVTMMWTVSVLVAKRTRVGKKNIIGHLLSANLFQTTFSHNINPDGDQFKFSMIKVNCKANSDLHHRP